MTPREIPAAVRERVREAAGNACGYCLSPQPLVMAKLEVEHIFPRAHGGGDEETNLWLSSSLCNRYKGSQIEAVDLETNIIVPLFNPRRQVWPAHFRWSADGTRIIGETAIGRATVNALQLNNELAVEVRRNWVLAGWHPPRPE